MCGSVGGMIPALWMKQEDFSKFKVNMAYIVTSCSAWTLSQKTQTQSWTMAHWIKIPYSVNMKIQHPHENPHGFTCLQAQHQRRERQELAGQLTQP